MPLVHLHRHSEYSLLDGTGTADQYAARAAELGQNALAISDHGTLAGVLHHIIACEKNEVKPIVGMEAYWRSARETKMVKHERRHHLLLLAKNQTGFRNLMRMSSEAYRSGMSGPGQKRPCVDWDLLERYREGIIASTACLSSPLSRFILMESDRAHSWLRKLKHVFRDDVLMEIMPGDSDEQRKVNVEIMALAEKHSVPVIATADVHYPYQGWHETQDVLLMINTGQSYSLRKKKRDSGEDVYTMKDFPLLYMMNEQEMVQAFAKHHPKLKKKDVKSAITMTQTVADSIDVVGVDKSTKLPRVKSVDTEQVLRQWCFEGLRRIGKTNDQEYIARFEYEFQVLRDFDVVDYFYIIGDLVRWARGQGIRVGIGRGSAAGSLVSYLVRITGIDPIAHGLFFERFLNPGRKSLPDIDIDFQDDRRGEVVEYLYKTYGTERVCGVSAFQRFGARSAISEVARVHDVPFEDVKKITKLLDDEGHSVSLAELRGLVKKLDSFATMYPVVWDHACRLEGQVRALSQHPAGVVVTEDRVEETMPLMLAKSGDLVTAWSESKDVKAITDYGWLKIDVLGTTGLRIQALAVENIKKSLGIGVDLDDLPVMTDPDKTEPKVIEVFGKASNLGVFQFGSGPLTNLLKQIKPDHFNDLVAANALIRPGPFEGGMAHSYVERKNKREPVEYWHPSLVASLEETFGLMTYQEQVMEVVKELAGFSLAEADDVRSAVGKKVAARMEHYEAQFVTEAAKKIGKEAAEDIWHKIIDFSGYAFNRAHAAGYSAQAYQDMHLKVYFPREYYAALASADPEKIPAIISEAHKFNIEVYPPHINFSLDSFVVEGDRLRYGFVGIKNVGDVAIEEILVRRPFLSYDDFEERVEKRKVNSRVKETLVAVGAFDHWGMRDDWTLDSKIAAEMELLGVSLSGRKERAKHLPLIASRIVTEEKFDAALDGDYLMVGGEIVAIKQITTRKGEPMAFVDLAFEGDSFNVTVFPRHWMRYQHLLVRGNAILVYGTKDSGRNVLIADQMKALMELVHDLENYSMKTPV